MAEEQDRVRVVVEVDRATLARVFGEEYVSGGVFAGYLLSKIARSVSDGLSTPDVVVGYLDDLTGRSVRFDNDGRIDIGELADDLAGALR